MHHLRRQRQWCPSPVLGTGFSLALCSKGRKRQHQPTEMHSVPTVLYAKHHSTPKYNMVHAPCHARPHPEKESHTVKQQSLPTSAVTSQRRSLLTAVQATEWLCIHSTTQPFEAAQAPPQTRQRHYCSGFNTSAQTLLAPRL